MTWPPPRAAGSGATVAPKILNLTSRIGSSQSGPSRAPHWKPCFFWVVCCWVCGGWCVFWGWCVFLGGGWGEGLVCGFVCWVAWILAAFRRRFVCIVSWAAVGFLAPLPNCTPPHPLHHQPPTQHRRPHLHDARADRAQQALVDVGRQRVVEQRVGAVGGRAERPDAAGRELVPAVAGGGGCCCLWLFVDWVGL